MSYYTCFPLNPFFEALFWYVKSSSNEIGSADIAAFFIVIDKQTNITNAISLCNIQDFPVLSG